MDKSMQRTPKRVFILGAGFSKPAGFPLATGLTNEILELIQKNTGADYELLQFAEYINKLHQWITQSSSLLPLNIEEFYEYATEHAERLRMDQHFTTVGRLYGETPYGYANDLIKMLSYMDDYLLEILMTHENSATLDAVERFARNLRPEDTVITFNYDRLVERCLTQLKRPWSFGLDDNIPDNVRILKMHGSLDWIAFKRHTIFEKSKYQHIFSKTDVNRNNELDSTNQTEEHEYDFELFRISDDILQNVINIRSMIQQDFRWGIAGLGPQKKPSKIPGLGVVWENARKSLFHADHIVIVGFSFSQYDRLAQIEFARVAAGRDEKNIPSPQITVIDPSLVPQKNGTLCHEGAALIKRIETVFRPAILQGVKHENFDWATLES
jgi:abortive infection AbiH-like protein/SIR2-like protein